MQTANEVGKYVTDGKMTYPYNAYLDDLIANGTLHYCERPATVKGAAPKLVFRTPISFTPDERLVFAQKLGITLGELTNMSPQEFETALQSIEDGTVAKPAEGFPA